MSLTDTTLEQTQKALRSNLKTVLVVAPAGCGKTYEACSYALEAATGLAPDRRVLFLAHTNAAVTEFRRRTRKQTHSAQASTIDAFCLELLAPYAERLGLPVPLHSNVGTGAGSVRFSALAEHSAALLARCPSIASMYACKYPVIILDEHQDASTAQHKAIMRIVESGSTKLRIFADRMQAIYGDEASSLVPWQTIEAASECRVELTIPQRWQKSGSSSGLGVWILEARNRLEHGYSLPSITPGCCVRFHPIDVEDFGFRPRIDGPVNKCLRSLLNRYKGSLAVVGWLKAQAYQLQIGGRGRLALNEGADFDEAQSALESFEKKAGKPQALALAVVKLFSKSKCGVTSARLNMIKAAIGRAELNLTGINEVGCLIEQLRPLYSTPDAGTACGVVRAILNSPPDWLTIRTPDCFSLLGQVSTADGVPCSEVLRQLIMQRKFRTSRRQRIASTIHKSKGLEFDHVIVTNFGATHFADTEDRRMLAYVAVSRACRTLDILVPARTPSPLLPSNLA